jgi:Uma2 family endonuclease
VIDMVATASAVKTITWEEYLNLPDDREHDEMPDKMRDYFRMGVREMWLLNRIFE